MAAGTISSTRMAAQLFRAHFTLARVLAILPVVALGVFWIDGSSVLFLVSVLFPMLLAFRLMAETTQKTQPRCFCITMGRLPSAQNAPSQAITEPCRGGRPALLREVAAKMPRRTPLWDIFAGDVAAALENGQFLAHFQPQISTGTHEVTGFEALARWKHPERGMIPPAEFLPAVEAAGGWNRLSEIMLTQAVSALIAWDRAGLHVPQVSVNFSEAELANPSLVEKISWELDRFELGYDRLTVEVLENVIASATEDSVLQNIRRLARLGCRIDLDDFGTGHASITTLRRFPIDRIKIDRSFVIHIDEDAAQQKMVLAIQTLAAQLGLATLAEGVGSRAELSKLAELGCGCAQGHALSYPMPLDETIPWLHDKLHHASNPEYRLKTTGIPLQQPAARRTKTQNNHLREKKPFDTNDDIWSGSDEEHFSWCKASNR